jgi:hypothetical protein
MIARVIRGRRDASAGANEEVKWLKKRKSSGRR